jgi:hypothetical protein
MDFAIPVSWRNLYPKAASSEEFHPKGNLPSFENLISDAQLLLSYAATTGASLNDDDVKILNDEIQKAAGDKSGSHDYTNALLAYSRVAKQLSPVTAYTLRECFVRSQRTVRFYTWWAATFVLFIVLASLLTFVATAMSNSMKAEIDVANSKTIVLRSHFGLGSEKVTTQPERPTTSPNPGQSASSDQDTQMDLQQLAISMRSIYGRAQQLRYLVYLMTREIDDPLPDAKPDERRKALELDVKHTDQENFERIVPTYQEVRAYAQSMRDAVAFWYGGIASSILPVFYALLGASAWSLRRMQIGLRDRTFASFGGSSAQMLVAAIAGTVISLFSGLFVSTAVSLSPLAWAFLAGYSSDSLFQVLDGVLRIRPRDEPSPQAVPAAQARELGPRPVPAPS